MFTPVDQRKSISIDAARDLIAKNIAAINLKTEEIDTNDSVHRIIAEDVVANHDLPTFRRSGVDGYACLESDLDHFPAQLKVV